MSKDGINSKDFLIGTLIGGIIGSTTALFLAPKSTISAVRLLR